ncbi:dihydroorotate dehydrogenase electron transfer subunit [Virgibacillus sp. W0430]|uniref:dihydroorotate dehydrogenase electron transfer subunit n=1 Tax=Virgibacillus sp. W0430 TaxID=3391580 RepID=UPI003F46ABAE
MMKKEMLEIIAVSEIALDTVEMKLRNSYISQHARPGQFIHILTKSHTLRRPISIAHIDQRNESITILFKKSGLGTHELASYKKGTYIDALGPCGNGFNIEQINDSTVLLIGGGVGVPPLYCLGEELVKQNITIINILGFQTKSAVFYEKQFQALGKTYVMTDDGSYGERGRVTTKIDRLGHIDRYYSCGPLPMLKAVANKLENTTGYLSFEERMGCGIGACFACVIQTSDYSSYKKICKDGPVFAASEVIV